MPEARSLSLSIRVVARARLGRLVFLNQARRWSKGTYPWSGGREKQKREPRELGWGSLADARGKQA